MKKLDLIIGKLYSDYRGERVCKLVALDKYGDPVLQPMNEYTKSVYLPLSEDGEFLTENPEFKGCFSLFLYDFNYYFALLKD